MKKYLILIIAVLMLMQSCAYKFDKNNTPLSQDTIPEKYENSSEVSVVSSGLYNVDEKQIETIKEALGNNEYLYFKDTVSDEIKVDSIYRCFWSTKYQTSGPDPATLDISAASPSRNIQYKTETDTESCIPVLSAYVYVNGKSYNLIAEYSEYYEELFQNLSYEDAISRIRDEDRTIISQKMLDKARIICIYDNSAKNRSEKWVKGKIATTDVRLSENDLTACEIVSKRLGKNYILYVDLSDYGELTKYPAVPLTADRLEKMMNDIQELLNESLPDEEVECLTLFLKNRQPKNENGFIADR